MSVERPIGLVDAPVAVATETDLSNMSILPSFVRQEEAALSTPESPGRPASPILARRDDDVLSMIRINENSGMVPSEKLMSDMGKLMEEMTRAGVLLSTAGLRPTSEGVRVRLARGKVSTIDGPFAETKEVIGGYAIIEAKSNDQAIELTKRFLLVHGDQWEIECEVRQLDEPDFETARNAAGCRTASGDQGPAEAGSRRSDAPATRRAL
jgi:hypothetical protein